MPDITLTVLETVSSTNTFVKENIGNLNLPALVIANKQTAGRGRQGKSFYSPENTGLYMTLVFDAPQNCSLLTPAAAVAVCIVLEKLGIKPGIKWVNDIFVDGLKACGILTERFLYGGKAYIALGIGINLTTSEFPDDLKAAGSVNIECDKARLALDISKIILEYTQTPEDDFILEEYQNRLFIIGKKIGYSKNNIEYSATVKGINRQCSLIVERTDGSIDILSSGEISIKL